MSKRRPVQLHVEWAPNRVRAVNIATGQRAEGATVSELGPILSGQRDALIGVGRGCVFLRTIRLPKASAEDLRRILTSRLVQLFPLPPEQLAFDFIQTTEQDSEGFLTIVAAMRTEDLKRLNGELQQAGVKAARILPIALGSGAVALRAGLKDALVIEGGDTAIALDVVQEGMVRFSRTVPPGSDPQSEARRTLSAAEAGNLPLVTADYGVVPDATDVSGGALERLDDAPDFAFVRGEDRVRAEKNRIAAKTRFAVLMALAAILLATLIWVEREEAQAKVTRASGVWAKELSKRRSIRDTETRAAQEAIARQTALKSAFEPAQPLSDIAAIIGDALPESAWTTGLSIERGKVVQIRGTVVKPNDVARFVDALGGNPRFRDVRLVFANSAKVDETPVVQFSMNATAVGNLPMPTPEKAVKRPSVAAKTTNPTTGEKQ